MDYRLDDEVRVESGGAGLGHSPSGAQIIVIRCISVK